MKFYIKTYQTETTKTSFFKKKYFIQLITIAVISDTGAIFQAHSKGYNSRYLDEELLTGVIKYLPEDTHRTWMKPEEIKRSLIEFLQWEVDSNGGIDIEFVFESPIDFAGFISLMGGYRNNHKWPISIPKTYTDISQSIKEYVEFMPDEEFDHNHNYTSLKIKDKEAFFRFHDKMDMFMSHQEYPERKRSVNPVEDAKYIRQLYLFLKRVKLKQDIVYTETEL